jgi:hypothetical protein
VRERLAWRWIGAHAAALGLSSALMGPLQNGWKELFGSDGFGFEALYLVLACGSIAFAQTRVPRARRFPVPFWLWGLTSCGSAVLGFAAAFSSMGGWVDLAKSWWPDSIWLGIGGVLVVPLVSFVLVSAIAQGLVLFWRTRSGTSWLWTSGIVIGDLFGVFLSLLKSLFLIGWVNAPGSTSLLLLAIGSAQGALLGITTLLPLRRILERPE